MKYLKFLFESEAVKGISSPSDYLYLKVLRFILSTTASWPYREIGEPESRIGENFLKYFHFIFSVACMIGVTLYIINHSRTLTFFELGHLYITVLMNIVNLSRIITLTLATRFRTYTKDFLTKIHLFFYKDKSEFAMKTHIQIHKLSHIFTICLTIQMVVGILLFNLTPMYKNYASGKYSNLVNNYLNHSTFEHPLYFSHPFNTSTYLYGYIIANILNWYISFTCSCGFVIFDNFLSVMVFQVWGHFKVLLYNLRHFPKPTEKSNVTLRDGTIITSIMYSKSEQVQIFELLKECINHHRDINNFTNTMSDVFGPSLFVYYVFHQASICLLLLECSQMTTEALAQYLPLTCVIVQLLVQMSIVFELIGSESEKLSDAVYGVPWEYMDVKNRKIVAIFLMNVQKPVHVKALGIARVGVTSMATILKTSLSYFTFLRSV